MDRQIISSTPHVRSKDTVQSVMRDVVIALCPAAFMGIYHYGAHALLLMAVSIAAAMFSEWAYEKALQKPSTLSDCSAIITGLLLAMNLPPAAPLWMAAVGSVFAIVMVKMLFGGLGQNFMNPALAGRAFLLASYPVEMTSWTSASPFGLDAVSTATPLASLKQGVLPDATMLDLLTGNIGGCLGETCAIALLIGAAYLLYKKVITWRIPAFYIGTVFILTAILGRTGESGTLHVPLYEILSGGLLLGAFFMATDYASSPMTPLGQIIYAIGCGLLTTLIRLYGSYPEGVSYSILIMNLCVPLLDRYTAPRIFGARKKEKGAKA